MRCPIAYIPVSVPVGEGVNGTAVKLHAYQLSKALKEIGRVKVTRLHMNVYFLF